MAGRPVAGRLGILHVDLDAFYASVEQLADPTLRGRPVVVGGLGPRGVVAAASYEARRFGVHSAMPMARARRACPDAVFLAPRFDAYTRCEPRRHGDPALLHAARRADRARRGVPRRRAASRRLHGTGARDRGRDPPRVSRAETGLTASVGVAATKQLAKLASDLAKPDGLLVVEPGHELEFLHPLPVERLWGVGPATRRRLAPPRRADRSAISRRSRWTRWSPTVGRAHGEHLHALAWNRDDRAVEPDRQVKSIGHEETFPTDLTDRAELEREVRAPRPTRSRAGCAAPAARARTVQLKLRYADFRTITAVADPARARPISPPISPPIAGELLAAVDLGDGVRLLGVSRPSSSRTPRRCRTTCRSTGSRDRRPGRIGRGRAAGPGTSGSGRRCRAA